MLNLLRDTGNQSPELFLLAQSNKSVCFSGGHDVPFDIYPSRTSHSGTMDYHSTPRLGYVVVRNGDAARAASLGSSIDNNSSVSGLSDGRVLLLALGSSNNKGAFSHSNVAQSVESGNPIEYVVPVVFRL